MELSSDLVEEILLRVPARSLARLRYTCKQWKTLISDPRFVNKHLPYMRCREQQFTLFNEISPSLGSIISCVSTDFKTPCLKMELFKPSDLLVYNMLHCDGLLLLVMRTKLLLLNPLLKEARWIKCGAYSFNHSMEAYGLGYISNQSTCKDYKMVRFLSTPYFRTEDVRAEVYDFKTDCWNIVDDKSFHGFFRLPLSSVCLRGTPYWIGYSKIGYSVSIQSFDFSKERFERLGGLSIGPIKPNDSFSLGIFREDHLALLHGSYLTGMINIRVMNLNKDWSKLMTVNAIPEVTKLPRYSSYFIENNGKLMLSIRHFKTGSRIYIVGENQECQKVEYYSSIDRSVGGCYYVPSLLQVPGFSRREEEE